MIKFKLILGGPGTGKTEYLIRIVEQVLASGRRPNEVAFVTFTRAAASEARQRAAAFLRLSPSELPHFRTLHSLCFKQLGLRRGDVLEGAALRELEELAGERDSRDLLDGQAGPWEIEQLARVTNLDAEDLARESQLDIYRFRRAVAIRAKFKAARKLLDFTDMLERYVDAGRPLDTRLAIIDEAQDLTPLQWKVVRRAFGDNQEVAVAGDDDQAIHEWAGATLSPLFEHNGERETLTVSHRLPAAVYRLAAGAVAPLARRIAKNTVPPTREGSVTWYLDPTEVSLLPGTWLLLARARYQLDELVTVARLAGVPYTVNGQSSVNPELLAAAKQHEDAWRPGQPHWHDALIKFPLDEREYLLACRRAGERLNVPPRVAIDTVHGAKGRQADHVLLLTDLTSRITRRAEADPDPECRVLYVGLTRARESLHIVQPRGLYAWSF